jgi:hypothetical protein
LGSLEFPDLVLVLAVLTALAAVLLAGLIALALRILLLLPGLLAAALLLTRALAGILVLLARILVLLPRHGEISLVGRQRRGNGWRPLWLPAEPNSSQMREPERKMTSVQASMPSHGQLQPPVPSCYKTENAQGLPGPKET